MKRHKVVLTAAAQADAIRAKEYYNRISPGLGNRFIKLFRLKVRDIGAVPYAHAIRYNNIRFAQLDKFPYAIHYFIDERDPLAIVIALHHEKEAPERWLHYST